MIADKATLVVILETLLGFGSYGASEDILWRQVNLASAKPVKLEFFRLHLERCRDNLWVETIADELDGTERWLINAAGKAVLDRA